MMKNYMDVPVVIAKEQFSVNFEFVATGERSTACIITIAGRVMVIDELFSVKNSNVPNEWMEPIIRRLRELLKGSKIYKET